jgi:hypothetical protein
MNKRRAVAMMVEALISHSSLYGNRLTASVVVRLLVSRIGPRRPDWYVSLIECTDLSNENCREGEQSSISVIKVIRV